MKEDCQRWWYVTNIIELILEVLIMIFPGEGDTLLALHKRYCLLKNTFPGDMSPALGVVDSRIKQKLIRRYLIDPASGASSLKQDLESGADFMEQV